MHRSLSRQVNKIGETSNLKRSHGFVRTIKTTHVRSARTMKWGVKCIGTSACSVCPRAGCSPTQKRTVISAKSRFQKTIKALSNCNAGGSLQTAKNNDVSKQSFNAKYTKENFSVLNKVEGSGTDELKVSKMCSKAEINATAPVRGRMSFNSKLNVKNVKAMFARGRIPSWKKSIQQPLKGR